MRYRPGRLSPALILSTLVAAMIAAILAASAPPAPVATSPASTTEKTPKLHFVSSDAVDFIKLLPAPPKPDTREAQADLEVVLAAQKSRTPAEVERAKSEAKLKMTAFSSVVGPWFTPENLPLTEALIKDAEQDSKFFSAAAKDYFNRKRPPNDVRIKPLIDEKDEPSYPSGHATRAILFASIIAELDPAQRDPLFDRAREVGWDRIVAGVHYPSDIIAGRVLGQALAQATLANPKFQDKLAAAKIEFEAAKKKYPESAAAHP